MTINTLILRTAGTNCDAELAHAFNLAGSQTQSIHLNTLIDNPHQLADFDILAFPGGFSYGDDIAAGRILANRLRHMLYPALRQFVAQGKPVIGVCNGFQTLVRLGLLGDFDPTKKGTGIVSHDADQLPQQTVTLADNAFPRFIDRWVKLKANPDSPCIWTRGLDELDLAIAHGEGRFVAPNDVLDRLESRNQIALRYLDNPNGSLRDIAGITDPSGLIFGLMPHPERHQHPTNHPQKLDPTTFGLKFFSNAVQHAQSRTAAATP